MKAVVAAALTAFLLFGTPGPASAHTPSDPEAVGNIGRLSAAANLIFRGKVASVRYRTSRGGRNGSEGVPYTFVTYAVSSVLQGSTPGTSITLRFIGGADGRGGFVEAEGVPLFEVGDEDILFVAGNGESGCPLVTCEFGRFRVLNEAAHEAHGLPVVSVEGGGMRAEGAVPESFKSFSYPAPAFDALMTRPDFASAVRQSGISVAEARARYQAEVPATIQMRIVEAETDSRREKRARASQPLPVEQFLSAVQSVASRSARRPLQDVRSIDPEQPIAAPASPASAPPATTAPVERLSPGRIIRKD